MRALLEVRNAVKEYHANANRYKALSGANLTISEGEFVSIMGASGSGKTTLLNCISGIDMVSSGEIIVDDIPLHRCNDNALADYRREKLGFIFQEYHLLDTLSIYDNIALPLIINKTNHREIEQKIRNIAEDFKIGDILEKYPHQVSGGQKQRCACIRAIIHSPSLVLADEPTGALDSKTSKMLLEALVQMNETMSVTILMVTHDVVAAGYAARTYYLQDGKIAAEISKDKKTRKEYTNEISDFIYSCDEEVNEYVSEIGEKKYTIS